MSTAKHCIPCHDASVAPMTPAEVAARIKETPEWEMAADGKSIHRRFTFTNFMQALAFTNKVGELSEQEGHHPDIIVGWGYADVSYWTHSIEGLHENDFIMAEKVNALI